MLVLLMVVHHHFHFLSLIECQQGQFHIVFQLKIISLVFFKVDFGCGGGGCDTL